VHRHIQSMSLSVTIPLLLFMVYSFIALFGGNEDYGFASI